MGKREKKSTKVESFDFSTDERSEVMKKRDMKGREKAREERIRVLKKGKRQELIDSRNKQLMQLRSVVQRHLANRIRIQERRKRTHNDDLNDL